MSQHNVIHAALKRGPLTADRIRLISGAKQPAARIHDLRARGIPIETRMVRRGKALVAEYRLGA